MAHHRGVSPLSVLYSSVTEHGWVLTIQHQTGWNNKLKLIQLNKHNIKAVGINTNPGGEGF